jgi:hypothetical protein
VRVENGRSKLDPTWQAAISAMILLIVSFPAFEPLKGYLFPRIIDPPARKIHVIGNISIPSGWSRSWDGYVLRDTIGQQLKMHCGPWPSSDYCLHKGVGVRDEYVPIDIIYYVENLSNKGDRNVIVSANYNGINIIDEADQVGRWRNSVVVYNGRKGQYISQERDLLYWAMYFPAILLFCLSIASLAVSIWRIMNKNTVSKV